MKEKFLELVKKVKQADISPIIQSTNAEELTSAWEAFWAQNPELLTEIEDWAAEYSDSEEEPIYATGEEISNPLEIVVLIHAGKQSDASECEIFREWKDLTCVLEDTGDQFATAVANCIYDSIIPEITAEDIFSAYEDLEYSDEDAADNADNDADDTSEG